VAVLTVPEVGIAQDGLGRHQQRILMGEDWLPWEVEIIVEDYLSMLYDELRDVRYNKSEHRRNLLKLLTTRGDGSIERKHQNISAAMNELNYPYIDGYKPLGHRQGIVYEIIERQIVKKPALLELITKLVEKSAEKPSGLTDILAIQVEPPVPPKSKEGVYESAKTPRVMPKRNFLEQEARNQSLGRAGEELVLEFEQQRLWRAGQKTLADRIMHVSTQGDGHGFDILSFENDGRERLVEVKTTRFGALTPFFASKNEVEVSDERSAEYQVYRLFDFSKSPRLFMLGGSMRSTCSLEPVQFRAVPGSVDE
jgi:hypothetical protein